MLNGFKFLFFTLTEPLIAPETYEKMLKIFRSSKNTFDSFNTVTEVKEFLLLENKPVNFQLNKAPNSQDLPDVIKLNFAINILSKNLMKNKKSLIGDNPYFFKLNQEESFDINTNHDFEVAEILHKNL